LALNLVHLPREKHLANRLLGDIDQRGSGDLRTLEDLGRVSILEFVGVTEHRDVRDSHVSRCRVSVEGVVGVVIPRLRLHDQERGGGVVGVLEVDAALAEFIEFLASHLVDSSHVTISSNGLALWSNRKRHCTLGGLAALGVIEEAYASY